MRCLTTFEDGVAKKLIVTGKRSHEELPMKW